MRLEIKEICEMIGIAETVKQQLLRYPQMNEITMELFSPEHRCRENARLALENAFAPDQQGFFMLHYMLHCLGHTYENYLKKDIPAEIFVATMRCFARFMEEHKQKNGFYAFDRDWWVTRQIAMVLFRIGELEYEFTQIQDEPVISIHIPSDAKLTLQKCQESLNAARIFIETFYPEMDKRAYVCESWLLSPALTQLLPPESNIIKFQQMFKIVQWDKENLGFLEWIFPCKQGTPYSQLPENSTLQIRVKESLLAGGQIGWAYGRL